MNKSIVENFSTIRRIRRVFFTSLVVSLLVMVLTVHWINAKMGRESHVGSEMGIFGCLVFFLSIFYFKSSRALQRRAKGRWFSDENWLRFESASGSEETISWHQIIDMRFTGRILAIEWPRSNEKRSRLNREYLYVDRATAAEMIERWRKIQPYPGAAKYESRSRVMRFCGKHQIAMGTVLLMLSSLPMLYGPLLLLHESSSIHWPAVTAKITSSSLEPHNGAAEVIVTYAFNIDGRVYTGSQFNLWSHGYVDLFERAKSFASQHREGDFVTVYYNPENPRESVIVRGVNFAGDLNFVIMGVALAAMGMFTLLRGV